MDLIKAFKTACGKLEHESDRPDSQPVRMTRVNQSNLLLIEIMRAANGGQNGFNPDALQRFGIDPKEFCAAWALGYAHITLGYHDRQLPFQDVLIARCNTCLDTEGEYSFGRFLPEDIKNKVEKKLAKNNSPGLNFDL